ncbi:hypothetical protein GCM10010425_59560 [Streptomyces spororaveus]|uniref:Uncharacterized protein n=1 Tax=Streptomyces spororaveus TaxID=284039 RepID=A0ABQ3T6Y7_9ACTN|nr:hypothetical protein [Streptomyces spororaveus]GHI76173.1 hypothetical protein Sspor_17340 [Streptomyces spororaveus]
MTKRGSNDRKAKARSIAREHGVRVTEAHSRLLRAKNRSEPAPSVTEDEHAGRHVPHELRIHRTVGGGLTEVLDAEAAAHAVWWDRTGSLTAGCRCGWVNPHLGPSFPTVPAGRGPDTREQTHWRWYHLAAWAEHAADAEEEPPLAEYVQDPSISINNLTREVICELRLLLHHAQDDRETVATDYAAVEAVLRTMRIRNAHTRAQGSGGITPVGPPDHRVTASRGMPASLEVLLRRTDSGHGGGRGELLAVELAAAELRRLVLHEPELATVASSPTVLES